MTRALTVADVIAGEAVSGTPEERIADMRAIASVIANRANLLGVTQQQVVANQNEFNIYGQRMPPGTTDLVGMAQEAIDYVAANGPVNSATFYATPEAADRLPGGLSYETETAGHQYFSDPQNRSINTAAGLKTPDAYAYAANLSNVPVPANNPAAIPTANPALLAAAPLANVDPNIAFGVADPLGLPSPDLATAQNFEKAAPALNPWGGAPLSNVTASGILGSNPALTADTRAQPKMDVPVAGLLGANPALSANASVQGLPEVATVSSRMGLAEPGFDQSRFDGDGVTVADGFDPGRFADPAVAGFDPSRFGGASIDVATNTQQFAPQRADLGSFPDAMAAQRGPPTGILSAEMGERMADVQRQLQDPSLQAPMMQTPSVKTAYVEEEAAPPAIQAIQQQTAVNVPANGLLGTNPALAAQASVPSLPSAMTPQQIAGYQQAAKSFANAGLLNIGQQPPTDLSGNLPANLDVLGNEPATALESIEVADQPAVSDVQTDIPGPATTTAADQQQVSQTPAKSPTTVSRAAVTKTTPSFADRAKAAINPGTAIGAALRGFLGLPGAAVGGLLRNAAYQKSGFLNQPAMSINNIGGGSDAVYSIWDGGMAPGTQATASDGQTVTAMSGGRTAITNKNGVVTVFDNTGKAMSYFGNDLDQDQDESAASANNGGFFGGLFG